MARIREASVSEARSNSGHSGTASANGTPPPPAARPKIKSTACHRCHSRKVKCSGGHPCQNCRSAGKGPECTYPRRNRQVKVNQHYIDGLLEEIERLKAKNASSKYLQSDSGIQSNASTSSTATAGTNTSTTLGIAPHQAASRRLSIDASDPAKAVTLEVRPWFVNVNSFPAPILISEAADAAFATRFRQTISDPQSSPYKHIPRVHYASDQELMALAESDVPWPSPSRSRFLVEVALKYVSRSFHVVRRSVVMENLEQSIHNPAWGDSLLRCKFWGLFAIGELYSTRSTPSRKDFPGMAYFAKATRVLGVLIERPELDYIEIIHLLSYYSLALNRRYSAYALCGYAMRSVVVMGLHLNIPVSQLRDPATREHRRRVFWTTYVFDRMWASKLGHPPAIRDDDIQVELPSTPDVQGAAAADFADPAYYVASLKLASLITNVVRSIYSRSNQNSTLSIRVQQALKDLRGWVEDLPSHLHVETPTLTDSVPKPVSLHLSFNQCAILSTRPVLLHVLRTHVAAWPSTAPVTESQVPASAITLSDACVRCARHSVRLLTECWIDGSFATFDHAYTRYLFSALSVLAASSLLDYRESAGDREAFEEAARFLEQLKEAGNFCAQEFWQHVDAMKTAIEDCTEKRKQGAMPGAMDAAATMTGTGAGTGAGAGATPSMSGNDVGTGGHDPRHGGGGGGASSDNAAFLSHFGAGSSGTGGGIVPAAQAAHPATAGMALTEPSLQELLAQPVLDLQFLEGTFNEDYSQALYWPDFSAENWNPETWTTT